MDASDSKLSSVKSSSFLLITGLTILSALFITILVVIQEVHDPIRIGEMIFFTHWILIVTPMGLIILNVCYLTAVNYPWKKRKNQLADYKVPEKFNPHFLLIKLHNETGQQNKAISIARNLSKKEIKHPLRAIAEMMIELGKITTNNNTESTSINKEKGKNYTYKDQFGFKLQFW